MSTDVLQLLTIIYIHATMMIINMRVLDAQQNWINWRLAAHYNTMRPLQWLMKVFTLESIEHQQSIKEERCLLIRQVTVAILLGVINFYTLHYKILYVFDGINLSVKASDTVQMIYDYCQFIVDLYFVNKYGRKMNLEYVKQYQCIDKILDLNNHSELHRRIRRLLIIFLLIWSVTSALEFLGWYLNYGWWVPTVYGVSYIFLFIKILTVLDLTTQVIHVERRLRNIADFVHSYYISASEISSQNILFNDTICNKNWFYCNSQSRAEKRSLKSNPLKSMSSNLQQEVKLLSRCYLILTEQCHFINKMYGIRVLLNSLSLLIDMVRYANVAIRLYMEKQHTPYDEGSIAAVTCFVRLLPCASVLFSLVYHCEQTYRQAERIISIIQHILLNKNPSTELKTALIEFRELIQSQPIMFSSGNFFTLNYGFLVSTTSVVVTYTIILLQNL